MNRSFVVTIGMAVACASLAPWAQSDETGWYRGGQGDGDQILASPLVVDLDSDGYQEIIVPAFDDNLYVYRHDGTSSSSWPVDMGFTDGMVGSAAAGDVDGDGSIEIVIVGDDGEDQNAKVKVYELDGSLRGSAVSLGTSASAKATPCLIDCYRFDGATTHPAKEIVIRDGTGNVNIIYWNASDFAVKSGFSLNTCTDDSQRDLYGRQAITPSVSAVYLGAGVTYLVVASTNDTIYRRLITSTSSANWTVATKSDLHSSSGATTKFYSSPAVVDLDGDSSYEVVAAASDGKVYVWDYDGGARTGWPQSTSEQIVASPAVADLDDDGDLEIIVGSEDGQIYVWNADGTAVSGWPQATLGDVFGSPAVAEIDGSAGLEIVAVSLDKHIYAWSRTGQKLPGWPKRVNTMLYSSPAIGDIHGSGRMSIITAGYDGRVFCFDLDRKSLDPTAGWLQFRGGPTRQGNAE